MVAFWDHVSRELFRDGLHCWVGLLGVVISGGILTTAWGWWARRRMDPVNTGRDNWIWTDVALTLIVAGLSACHHVWLHDAINGGWYPYAQDFRDYLTHTMAALEPGLVQGSLFRYPMFGWISAAVCRIGDLPPYLGTMWASLVSSILIPVALFLLGRQIAPRPVAIAGAFFFCHFHPVAMNMGTPTDYPFCTLAYISVLAAGMWALRKGGAGPFLVFGVICAIMLGATAKGLTVVLPALAFGFAGLAWHGRTRPKRISPALAAFVLPLAAIWAIYHHAEVKAFSLEFQVLNVMNGDAWALMGKHVQPSPVLDWDMNSPSQRMGYWVVGRTEALTHFPSVIRFFLHPPAGRIDFAIRARGFMDALSVVLNLKAPWLFLLAIPGCLACLFRPARTPWIPLFLASGLLFIETLGQVWGGLGVQYEFRYLQPLITTLPLLMLTGAWVLSSLLAPRGSRLSDLAFWPVIPLLAVVLFFKASPFSATRLTQEIRLPPIDPLYDLWNLQGDLWPGDGLVDLTPDLVAHFVYYGTTTPLVVGRGLRVRVGEHEYLGVRVAASGWRRRLLIEDAYGVTPGHDENQFSCMDRWFAARPDRFRRIRPHIVEDLAPELPISIHPSRDCQTP